MKRIIITVETEEQARDIIDVLDANEEAGMIDFAFNTEVLDFEACVKCGKPARPYSDHCSACLAKLVATEANAS